MLKDKLLYLNLFNIIIAQCAGAKEYQHDNYMHPTHLEMSIKPGNKRTLREADIFIPIEQTADQMFFANIRGMLDTKHQKEGNAGLGYRHILNNNFILGGYVHGDIRRSQFGNKHYQIAFGLEMLSEWIDVRANKYQPKQRRFVLQRFPSSAMVLNNLIYTGDVIKFERALPGFDIEMGFKLPIGRNLLFAPPFIDEMRFYIARYHFHRRAGTSTQGMRGRLEASISTIFAEELAGSSFAGTKITFGGEISKDNVRGYNRFFEVRLRIPITQGPRLEVPIARGLRRRLSERIVRDVDVVSNDGVALDNAQLYNPASTHGIDYVSGQSIYWVDLNATSNGNGTFDNPANEIPSTAANQIVMMKLGGNWDLGGAGMPTVQNNTVIMTVAEIGRPLFSPKGQLISAGSRPHIICENFVVPSGNFAMIGVNLSGSSPDQVLHDVLAGLGLSSTNHLFKNMHLRKTSSGNKSLEVHTFGTGTATVTIDGITMENTAGNFLYGIEFLVQNASINTFFNVQRTTFSDLDSYSTNLWGFDGAANITINFNGGNTFVTGDWDLRSAVGGGTRTNNINTTYGPNITTGNVNYLNWP